MESGDLSQNTFVQMFNLELNKKNIQDVELTKGNYKQVLLNESNKAKSLQEELRKIEQENEDLRKQIQNYKADIDQNKTEYTNLILGLRNEIKTESTKLDSLYERNNELDEINRKHKETLEKIRLNIETEVRKRKNAERKLDSKNIERAAAVKQLDLLKNKHKILKAEVKSVDEQIDESVNTSAMLEEKYKNSVDFGRSLSSEYKELELQNVRIEKEKDCLAKLLNCHENTNSKLAQMIIENINPCEDRMLLTELCEMMSNIDKENNRHQHVMEQIHYERDMQGKVLSEEHGKSYQNFNLGAVADED